jgi:hypothetical protein
MNGAVMGPSMMNSQGQAFANDFAGGAMMQPRAAGVSPRITVKTYPNFLAFANSGELGR